MTWEPIETAPKDGTQFVMLDAAVNTATVGSWMEDVEWINAGKMPGEAKAVPSWFPLHSPTHWMPLSPPPETTP
jgi:hypothetical protein